jgi:uncharacterized membrane protein
MLRFLKSTIVGGLLFVLPLLAILVVVRHALHTLADLLGPVAEMLPQQKVAGMVVADVLAIVTIVALCFLAGLFVGTQFGRGINDRLERIVLRKVPGYTLVKGAARGLVGLENDSDLGVALARIEDDWVLAFIVERHDNGLSTVFVPSAPTPAAGAVYYLPDERLKRLDVPVTEAIACVMRLGVGSRELLAKAGLELKGAKGSH